MIDILNALRNFIEDDKKGVVLSSFLQQMIDLLVDYGEKARDGFWVELLGIISFSIRDVEKTEEIYAKSKLAKSNGSLQIGSVHIEASRPTPIKSITSTLRELGRRSPKRIK